MKLILEEHAVDDFEWWVKNDLKILKKIADLFSAFLKDPYKGIGKPEGLKANLKGFWSRRINDEHRIVYTITSDSIIIISCRSHYKL